MAKVKYYPMPDYKQVTTDINVYINAWQQMAKPIEQRLNMTLSGFDPQFMFSVAGSNGQPDATVTLPVWFVQKLAAELDE